MERHHSLFYAHQITLHTDTHPTYVHGHTAFLCSLYNVMHIVQDVRILL